MFKHLVLFICIFAAAGARAEDLPLIKNFYSVIAEHRAEPTTAEKMTVDGLGGLTQTDKDLLFANGREMVYLYYRRRQVDLWKKPEKPDDINAWAEITQNVTKAAAKFSAKAKARDFELTEKIFAAAAAGLNDGSRYYSELEPEEEDGLTPVRPFARRLIDDILYVRIGNFSAATKQNVEAALADYPQAKGFILDLRGNRGGLLTAAIDVAGIFIDGGIITSVEGRDPAAVKYYNAGENSRFNLPMVVLIDGETASSAEVVAAALSEQIQAKLVGTNSFGKGSIQEMYRFENGGKLALTTAHFYTPSGQKIDKIGLIPDYCTENIGETLPHGEVEAYTNQRCGKENRVFKKADIELAVMLLKRQLSLF